MSLHVKDPEVEQMARRLATIQGIGLTEAVRRALRHELARQGAALSLVETGLAFVKFLHSKSGPHAGKPADKTHIDDLYGDH